MLYAHAASVAMGCLLSTKQGDNQTFILFLLGVFTNELDLISDRNALVRESNTEEV